MNKLFIIIELLYVTQQTKRSLKISAEKNCAKSKLRFFAKKMIRE